MTTTSAATASSNAAVYEAINARNGVGTGSTTANTAADQNERFLKLLTAQLNNQDPLNPLDNAQMTSQVAQISTVSGLEKLNTSMSDMASQFLQLQMLQGASLVGREVLASGNTLKVAESGNLQGGFELDAAASSATVEVLNSVGNVVYSKNLGAQAKGRQEFDLSGSGLPTSGKYTFRVSAVSGGQAVEATTLMRDTVSSVTTKDQKLSLLTAGGSSLLYSDVKTIK